MVAAKTDRKQVGTLIVPGRMTGAQIKCAV